MTLPQPCAWMVGNDSVTHLVITDQYGHLLHVPGIWMAYLGKTLNDLKAGVGATVVAAMVNPLVSDDKRKSA